MKQGPQEPNVPIMKKNNKHKDISDLRIMSLEKGKRKAVEHKEDEAKINFTHTNTQVGTHAAIEKEYIKIPSHSEQWNFQVL